MKNKLITLPVISPQEIHKVAKAHGFWDNGINPEDIPEKLCLIHSEVSEAMEAVRKEPVDYNNFVEELADIVIRVFDLAEAFKLDILEAIYIKHLINEKRPYKHGKKF